MRPVNGEYREKRKLLIVIGAGNTGKSAFVKELVCKKGSRDLPPQIPEISISCGPKQITCQCRIYPAHASHELLPDKETLYVMDTPSLYLNQEGSLVGEEIDRLILYKAKKNEIEYEILGVAFLNWTGCVRYASQEGDSSEKQLADMLKFCMEKKKELVFYVACKWDYYSRLGKVANSCYLKAQGNRLRQVGLDEVWNKRIFWSSCPGEEDMAEEYIEDFYQTEKGKVIIQEQWKKLRENLRKQIPFRVKFQEFKKDYDQVWMKISPKIKQNLLSGNRYIYKLVSLNWKLKLSNAGELNKGAISKGVGLSLMGVTAMTLGLLINIKTRSELRLAPSIASIGGTALIACSQLMTYQNTKIEDSRSIPPLQQRVRDQIVLTIFRDQLVPELIQRMKMGIRSVKIESCSYLHELKVTNTITKKIMKIVERRGEGIQIQIDGPENSEYIFEFTLRAPPSHTLSTVIRQVASQFYN